MIIREAGSKVGDPQVEMESWEQKNKDHIAKLAEIRGRALDKWSKHKENTRYEEVYREADWNLKETLRKSLNANLQSVAQELQSYSNKPDKRFFELADSLKMHHGTGGWVRRNGHIADVATHLRKTRKHFERIANIARKVYMETVKGSPSFDKGTTVSWDIPTLEEVRASVRKLKNNRSQDMIGVQPEMLKAAFKDPRTEEIFTK